MIGRFGHRPANPLARRLVDRFRLLFLGGIGKAQSVYFVDVRGQRYKRVVFGDSRQAEIVESNLERLGASAGLPGLVLRHENEIWLEFVHGRAVDAQRPEDFQALAELFAAFYRHDSKALPSGQTRLQARLLSDLSFLADAGVLSRPRAVALAATADSLLPESIWLGFDYVDPVIKNFVMAPRGLVAIDVESVQAEQPLGTGVAKCRVHWLGDRDGEFVERIIAAGAPDFRDQLRYVELCFLAAWTKRKLLSGKRGLVDPQRFASF
jgi:hypothetical protein